MPASNYKLIFLFNKNRITANNYLRIGFILLLAIFFVKTSVAQCDNYLHVATAASGVQIGQLDMVGNQLTIEAIFKRTDPYSGGLLFAGDLVSKHSNSSDCNYLLRPNGVAIATTNGFSSVDITCEIELNKTYHVAMVYDGSTLKFYRNGVLKGSAAASGNLITNNLITTIGSCAFYPNNYNEDLIGYINEVRFWNVARTQAEINQYLITSLPNPTTQTGLLAYYQFDDLLNKQGNAMWNASILGNASINATNPNCTNALTDNCLTLPIKLLSFSAALQNVNNAILQWQIATAEDASKYELQRSTDSRNFMAIDLQRGNSFATRFNYTDNTLHNGTYYYRLKITDHTGKLSYSNTAVLKVGSKEQLFSVYPNPVKKGESLQLNLQNITADKIEIVNIAGQVVYSNANKQTGSFSLPISFLLPSGYYILKVISDYKIFTQKISIQ
ncbi:LamG-like jellyroll fold domain-containing protein [Ferruginibacter sp. SUN106]|uniref:LamG-like jellyroll fold domain-containing protein n=1 Tax=Ferruginibacter sp. SUN106 TaxID=2978348 RepID=UPI003D36E6B6